MHVSMTQKPSFTLSPIAGREDYASPVSVTFSAQDTVGSVKKVELTVNDDSRVEGPETVHVVIVTDSGVMNPVTTQNQGVAAVTLLDTDSRCLMERLYIHWPLFDRKHTHSIKKSHTGAD